MTKAERNKLYYQENRERLKEQARQRRREKRQNGLSMIKGEGSDQAENKSQQCAIQTVSIFQSERWKGSDIDAGTFTETGGVQNEPQLPTETSSKVNDGIEAEFPKSSDNASASPAETSDNDQLTYQQDIIWFQPSFSNTEVTSFECWTLEFQLDFMSMSEHVQQSVGTGSETNSTEPMDIGISSPFPEEFSMDSERVQAMSQICREDRAGTSKWHKSWTDLVGAILSSPATLFRLVLVGWLTWLLTVLQIGFYREHDIDPSLAVPMALACELSLISLVMMSCKSNLENFLRCAAYTVLFGYVIGSLGFDVLYNKRQTATQEQVNPAIANTALANLESRLEQAQSSLEIATKGRSWDNMAIFGKQVEILQARIDEIQSQNSLGWSDTQMIQSSVLLIVLLRAVIMIVNSLNAHKLRDELESFNQQTRNAILTI